MPTVRKYAEGTSVSAARSREEIDKMLRKYGATGFGYVDQERAAAIMFELNSRTYRYLVTMPRLEDFKSSGSGYLQSAAKQKAAWEQAVREQWRALVATIKGKLVAVENGIETVEEAFMRNTVMSNGQTVAEYVEPQLTNMYSNGELPKMLPGKSEFR